MQVLGIDIGGSGIKGAPVDLATGDLATKRYRVPTPQPSTPAAVVTVITEIIRHHDWRGPVGVTVPGVVIDGVVLSAANIDHSWIGFDAETVLSDALGEEVTVLNDADAAGLAEARFGAARDREGVCLLLTFGTGIGSALINDGVLLPNTEFGHLEFRGTEAEAYAAARLVERENMDIDWWARRVAEFLEYLDFIFSPTTIVIGGGISKRFEEFGHYFTSRAVVLPATLRNNAGIVGAAMAARDRMNT